MRTDRIADNLVAALRQRQSSNFDLYKRFVNPAFVDLLNMAGFGRRFVRSSGLELIDERGTRYLDFLSGYGALNLGHNHPAVKEVLRRLLEEDVPGFTQVECSLATGLAAEALVRVLPEGFDRVYFCNSGSEAVDAAIKLARAVTRRKRVLCCEGAFHGNTLGVLGLMDNPARRDRFRPLVPGFDRIPYGDSDALHTALRWRDVAALVIEPVQGEGGALVPPPGFLNQALELCRRYQALLIVDEVQSGLGRTGKMFAIEHSGLLPDAIALAKSLSGGLCPVGAMVTRGDLFERAYGSVRTCLDHKTTFGGGPLAMGAVLATLGVLEEEGLVENAAVQGKALKQRLEALRLRFPLIRDVRGLGLMLGVKFADISRGLLEHGPFKVLGAASADLLAQYVSLRLINEHRIVTQVAANDLSVLKVMPPLSVTSEAIDRFVVGLEAILSDGTYTSALLHLAREFVQHRGGT